MLRIAVRNSNVNNITVFQNLEGVFNYNNWVSTKRNQHRMTAGGLGNFLKRVLGMGYASWTGHDDSYKSAAEQDSFEDKQWNEPVILRFNKKEYRVFIIVIGNGIDIISRFEGPIRIDNIGTDTEVEVVLPLYHSGTLDTLRHYHNTFRLVKRNVDFSFSTEVVEQ
jgi:hypothetical protein